jgi:hypothetical protein
MAIGAMENYVEIIYHGEPRNIDNVSVGTKLATKLERFGALFDNEGVVLPCFGGRIAGQHVDALGVDGCFVFRSTLNNIDSKISGETIINLGKEVLKACKKYLALWKECLDAKGAFKSGLNDDSALQHVRNSMWAETNMSTIVLEEKASDKEPYHIAVHVDTGKNHNENKMPPHWFPPFFSAFVLFGPYSKTWGYETSELFSVDAALLDSKKTGRDQHRKQVKKENDNGRKIEPDRGMPSAAVVHQGILRAQTQILANSSRVKLLKEQVLMCEKLMSYEKDEEAKEPWMKKLRIAAWELTESQLTAPIALDDPITPLAAIPSSIAASSMSSNSSGKDEENGDDI